VSVLPVTILISKSLCHNANHNVYVLFISLESSVFGAVQYSVLATSEYLNMRSLVRRNRRKCGAVQYSVLATCEHLNMRSLVRRYRRKCGAVQYSVLATCEYLNMRSLIRRNRQESPNSSFTCQKNQILNLHCTCSVYCEGSL